MKKLMHCLKIVVIVIIALEVIISAGCNTVNDTTDINISNGTTNTADINSLNYIGINSKQGYMCESLDKIYLLTRNFDSDNNYTGTIWADGEKLAEGEITRIYADNGNVYYNASGGVYKLNTEGMSQVLGKETIQQVVNKEKIYYRDIESENGNFYCYNMNDKTNSLVYDGKVLFLYANSDYIICYSPHDIIILDSESFTIIKHIHSEKIFTECSLDNDNVYYAETVFIDPVDEGSTITKYNIKRNEQTMVLDSNEPVGYVLAVDDKIIIEFVYRNEAGFRYIDMRNMENKYLTIDDVSGIDYNIYDILFDGQRIIYAKEDETVYSISIFTGETKQIELISKNS